MKRGRTADGSSAADPFAEYFARLERRAEEADPRALYLWPRTPVREDLQHEIATLVGVSDLEDEDPRSRPAWIARQIGALRGRGLIRERFDLLDVCCGDGVVLWRLQRRFPGARCRGVDCNVGRFRTHEEARRAGVRFHRAYIQHLFRSAPPQPFDVILMLNTYRGWESADLPQEEADLPQVADAWLARHGRYVIVTAKPSQIAALRRIGCRVRTLGPGEQDSLAICFSRHRLPGALRQRLDPRPVARAVRAHAGRFLRRWLP